MGAQRRFPVVRGVTAAAVVVLAACGGGGGSGVGARPALESLWPLATTAEGTRHTFDIVKVVTRTVPGAPKNKQFEFRVDHAGGLDLVQLFFGLDMSGDPVVEDVAGFTFSTRGLEGVLFNSHDFDALGGPCITVATPSLLLAPTDFRPGDTHTCSLTGIVDAVSLTWVGPQAVPGHADAHRFDFSIGSDYTPNNPAGPRGGATRCTVFGSFFLAPGLGPVAGTATQRFHAGTTVFEDRTYDFTLSATVLGP